MYDPEFCWPVVMIVPAARLLLAPVRSTSEIVPLVVGVQLIVIGCPAVALRPAAGILKGFW